MKTLHQPQIKNARKIEKKKDAGDLIKMQQPDYSNPRSQIALKFINEKIPDAEDKNSEIEYSSRNAGLPTM